MLWKNYRKLLVIPLSLPRPELCACTLRECSIFCLPCGLACEALGVHHFKFGNFFLVFSIFFFFKQQGDLRPIGKKLRLDLSFRKIYKIDFGLLVNKIVLGLDSPPHHCRNQTGPVNYLMGEYFLKFQMKFSLIFLWPKVVIFFFTLFIFLTLSNILTYIQMQNPPKKNLHGNCHSSAPNKASKVP